MHFCFTRSPPIITNNLGNSESCVHYMFKAVQQRDLVTADCSNVGRPVPSSHIYILLQGLQPAPVGVWGELVIAGPQVGWGYMGRPALTASKFLPDPWTKNTGARMYLTGDWARLLPTGDLEYRGRIDGQVASILFAILRAWRVKIVLWGEGGPWSPCKFFWGVAERGTKGHTLISSIQMPEILPPTISKGGRGGAVHVHKARPPPRSGRRNVLPERCDSVRLNVLP